jgi:drug/metabolite transporter (DMT)-like permease
MEHSITTARGGLERDPSPEAVPSRAPRVWAGAVLLLAGLLLIVLAGAFLIGATLLVRPDFVDPLLRPDARSARVDFLLAVLYFLAAMCMLGALVLFVLGVRGLVRVLQEGSG